MFHKLFFPASEFEARCFADIAREVHRVVQSHGADPLEGRFVGHNLGDEMVERPWFGVGSPDEMLPEVDMAIAPEWFIQTPYGPILLEENFRVGEAGLERLTDFPSKPQVIAR
jgi:Xaa-Pro aminopeptidase